MISDKLSMSTINGGKINVWNLSRTAKVYPHLELEQLIDTPKCTIFVTN